MKKKGHHPKMFTRSISSFLLISQELRKWAVDYTEESPEVKGGPQPLPRPSGQLHMNSGCSHKSIATLCCGDP